MEKLNICFKKIDIDHFPYAQYLCNVENFCIMNFKLSTLSAA